jgi:hypothetical protein
MQKMILGRHILLDYPHVTERNLLNWVQAGLQPLIGCDLNEDMSDIGLPHGYRLVFPPGSNRAENLISDLINIRYHIECEEHDNEYTYNHVASVANADTMYNLRKKIEQIETSWPNVWKEEWESPNQPFSDIIELLKDSFFILNP